MLTLCPCRQFIVIHFCEMLVQEAGKTHEITFQDFIELLAIAHMNTKKCVPQSRESYYRFLLVL